MCTYESISNRKKGVGDHLLTEGSLLRSRITTPLKTTAWEVIWRAEGNRKSLTAPKINNVNKSKVQRRSPELNQLDLITPGRVYTVEIVFQLEQNKRKDTIQIQAARQCFSGVLRCCTEGFYLLSLWMKS